MKWKRRWKARSGEKRIVKKFLWLPVFVRDEWRWLERACIEQCYVRGATGPWGHWFNERWVEVATD